MPPIMKIFWKYYPWKQIFHSIYQNLRNIYLLCWTQYYLPSKSITSISTHSTTNHTFIPLLIVYLQELHDKFLIESNSHGIANNTPDANRPTNRTIRYLHLQWKRKNWNSKSLCRIPIHTTNNIELTMETTYP